MRLPNPAHKKHTLKRKLFAYMCVLTILICVILLIGLFLIGSFTGTKQHVYETLQFQNEVFERQVDTYYDSLAVMNIQLSYRVSEILEEHLSENRMNFEELNDSPAQIEALQGRLIDALCQKLREADCTGIFVMLDAQVNSKVPNASVSRTGIYLQRNSLESSDTRVLLYRGVSEVGKDHDCMPHRKWRLEFNTEDFPNYAALKEQAAFPLNQSCRLSDVVLLPGTDQHVMLMTVPLLSEEGEFYGLCGFELNEGYFKQVFSQPSELDHAVFCISKNRGELELSESTTLSAGVINEYYLEPRGDFTASDFGNGLTVYRSDSESYIGISKQLQLCPGECTFTISALIPKEDYDHMLSIDMLRAFLLISVFQIIAGMLSMFFTKQYLRPLISALNNIRTKEYAEDPAYTAEIQDLFVFLAEQDRINEQELDRLRREKADAVSTAREFRDKYDETAKQNERLAYSRKDEIDPYDYENFKNNLNTLTGKEQEIFNFYMQGKTVKEIMATLGLQESTVRFHNKNIYAKLGVHSLKQLLRYAAILKQEESKLIQ